MFHHTIEPFGVFQKHVVSSADGAQRMAFVPGYGACLLELTLNGVSVVDGYVTPEEMIEGKYGKNILLYPFPNRLKNGVYHWQGREYRFPVNDPDTGNALHGFGKDRPMQVGRVDLNEHSASVSCIRYEPGDHEAYPFVFAFSIAYVLHAGGAFEVDLRFRNHSETPIPAGMGWHPYFRLAGKVDDMRLQMPPSRLVEIDNTMIPTGRKLPSLSFADLLPVNDKVIDNCFYLENDGPVAEVLLEGPAGRLRYLQQTGPGKFNYLQVFTPPHRNSIAIEPMSCNIDAFNNGMGLIALEPGEEAHAGIRVEMM